MSISSSRFNWVQTPSAWQQMQNWYAQRKAANQEFLDNMSAVSDAFSGAITTQFSGAANLAAQAAIDRLNAEVKAKQSKAAASASASPYPSLGPSITNVNNDQITLSDGTKIDLDSTNRLNGGSRIDLNASTLTLSNGTQIDLKAGLKKVNITA
jgi:hypothetical protein